MASLTLKGLPDETLARLRERAESERRSLNQQAIQLLERALADPRATFAERYDAFLAQHGPSPLGEHDFAPERADDTGRPSPFEPDGAAS